VVAVEHALDEAARICELCQRPLVERKGQSEDSDEVAVVERHFVITLAGERTVTPLSVLGRSILTRPAASARTRRRKKDADRASIIDDLEAAKFERDNPDSLGVDIVLNEN